MKNATTYDWMTRNDEKKQLLEEEVFLLKATEDLVQIMDDQGVSRAGLAQRMGTSRAFISQVLNGNRNMTLRTLFRICRALGYDAQIVYDRLSFEQKRTKLAASR